jgi:hypothetical protein
MKTLDENFSYGYNGEIYNLRKSINDSFECHYTRARYVPDSFRSECVSVAEKISDYAISKNTTPVILLSGGLDSEVVVKAFLESGRKFETITHRFVNELNAHEIKHVDEFCGKNGLIPNFVDLDVEPWLLSDESLTMADESKCINPEMLPTMKLIRDIHSQGKIPVLGNGDLYVSKEINPDWRMGRSEVKYQWMYIEYEYILAWMRYCIHHDIVGSINFFQQTPEIVLAMALDPMIQDLVNSNPVGKQSSRSTKYAVYKKYWPDLEVRPKHHGGEKIYPLCDYLRKSRFNKTYKIYTSKWKKPFHEFTKGFLPL